MNTTSACPVIVLITVNGNETHALLDAFVGMDKSPALVPKGGLTYNDLGLNGGCQIMHTVCEMGAGGIGASQQRTRDAIEHWHPRAVIAVGIAFGLDETKQAIGDVLVSTQIQDYELGRLSENGTITLRGDKPGSTDILRDRFRQTDTNESRSAKDWPKVRFGLIISGQKLVDNLDYRESLKALFTDAIGGEMEGVGLYVSASVAKVDWIVVKAICDWGHNKNQANKDTWQKLAARNAARVLKAALDDGGLYNDVMEKLKDAPPAQRDFSRIIKYAPAELIGREVEIKLLNDAWNQAVKGEPKRPHVITFVALGGEGKTSLVAKWTAELAHHDWTGCEEVFAWSFYSQGTQEQTTASSDLFLKDALVFFGDDEMASSARHASEKGKRLAQLVREKRALLILDGVEPLQYPPMPPMNGKLKDEGLAALLKGLAASSLGLCVVTTRYSIPDLTVYWQGNAPEITLKRLSKEAGVKLLKALGVNGIQEEFEKLVEDVRGHALTLNLLGSYLHDAHAGDIRKRDLVKLEEADTEEQGGHAFRVMDAYVQWFEVDRENVEANKKAQRALSVLRLLGLFDRPASGDCLTELLNAPAIPNLTEAFLGTSEAQSNMIYSGLEDAKLITVNRNAAHMLLSLDAHPLLREYFAKQLREQHLDSWREAHRRLYEHLCATTNEGSQPTLEDLQPLYQAVAHGCQAGMQQETFEKVYYSRIQRGVENSYSTKKLGAFGLDLGAVACFFDTLWSIPSASLSEGAQGWLMNQASICLRTLGRLNEALELLRAAINQPVKKEEWNRAAMGASNLCQLELTLGEINNALADGERAVIYADRGGFGQSECRADCANAIHQAGQRAKAMECFYKAEGIHAEIQPKYPLLFSTWGFYYCDFLLDVPECAAWRSFLHLHGDVKGVEGKETLDAASKVSERAAQTLRWVEERNTSLTDIGLDHLTLGRAALYAAQLTDDSSSQYAIACEHIEAAMKFLRLAAVQEFVVSGLLTRAWLRSLKGQLTGPDSAQADLDEAWEIAERGPMPLYMADIHLHRARLFFRESPYPWRGPNGVPRNAKHDLADARRLIEKHGYLRRMEELEDAERVIGK